MTPVRKIFHFDSPSEKYHCDASVVWCFDNRFEIVYGKFLKRIGVTRFDGIKVAGGAKSLASPDREFERTFVLEQIQISIRLHGTDRVILMLHSDCGAYGGLAGGFAGDTQAEAAHHARELQRAAQFLKTAVPGLPVECFFVDFQGVWEV